MARKNPPPEYWIWAAMKQRCFNRNNSQFKDYGGRGITVCNRWLKFEQFYADMGPRPTTDHSLERDDNDGDYCPENCRWATRSEQQSNTRRNRLFTYDGRTQTVTQWAEECGLSPDAITKRIDRGWPVGQVLTLQSDRGHCPKTRGQI
jgi:hypothetical protein